MITVIVASLVGGGALVAAAVGSYAALTREHKRSGK
jgi:hypothetical protein